MVAHARHAANADLEALRARADEIALAVRHQRDSRQMELASEEIRAQSRLSRAILCGVSADFIIPQIAHTARHHLGAEFIAVGRGGDPPVSGEGWDGPDEWAAAIRQGPLLQLWRKAFETGQACEITGECHPGTDRLAAGFLANGCWSGWWPFRSRFATARGAC